MPPEDNKKSDYNSMQAGMGLVPPSLVPMYSAKHPGDFAAQVSQMATIQAQQVTQMGMQARSFSPLATMNPFVQIGSAPMMPMPSAVPNMISGMGPPTGMFPAMGPGAGFGAFGASPYQHMPPPPAPSYMGQTPPLSPFPFAPRLPQPFFNTPFMSSYNRNELQQEMAGSQSIAAGGVGARVGTDLLAGGVGAMLGRRLGVGGGIGGLVGMGLSEFGGLGQFGQNLWMNTVGASQTAMAGRTAGVMEFSRNFITSGPFMSEAGAGFSRHASGMAARQITSMAGSGDFQRDTGGRFNTNDVFRIAQMGAENGLMSGVGSPTEMTQRVREVAKSLRMVMELANEPDVRQAIQTMGSLRGMGLNLAQTTDAVMQGRSFARQAGMTFQQLASTGGAMGAQTFASMGLTQGQGFMTGMHAMGSAAGSINQGVLSPQMAALVGGAQGYGAMNTAFSGQFMQSPVWAAMLNGRGGLSANNMMNMMTGRTGMFDMVGQAGGNMANIAGRMGPAGMGMMLGMQHYMQDSMMSAMTPEQRRMMEDRQVMGLSRTMGYRGGAGFMTAAQIMGMSGDQATARLSELSDPRYYQRQRDQIAVDRMERGRSEARQREADRPGFFDNLRNDYGWAASLGRGLDSLSARAGGFMNRVIGGEGSELEMFAPRSRREAVAMRRRLRSRDFLSTMEHHMPGEEAPGLAQYQTIAESIGSRGLMSLTNGGIAAGMLSGSDANARLAALRLGGMEASTLMNTSTRDERRARRQLRGVLGTDALSNIASDVGGIMNSGGSLFGNRSTADIVNGVYGGASNLASFGFSNGGGPVAGVRVDDIAGRVDASIRSQMQRAHPGSTSAQIDQMVAQNRRSVMQAVSSEAGIYMTRQGRERLQQAVGIGASADNTAQGLRRAGEHARDEGYQALFGNVGANERDSLYRGAREFTGGEIAHSGFGRSEEQQQRSRSLMASIAMANVAMQQTAEGSPERAAAVRRLRQLAGVAHAEFGNDASRMLQIATRQAGNAEKNRDARLAASRSVSGTRDANGMINAVTGALNGEYDESAMGAIGSGFQRVSRLSGAIGEVFQGVQLGSRAGNEELQGRLRDMSNDRVQEFLHSSSAIDREFGSRIREARRSGNMGGVMEFLRDQGADTEERRRQYNNRRSGIGGFLNRTFRDSDVYGKMGESFEQYDSRVNAAGGQADAAAANRTAEVSGAERQAGAQGLMAATDNFNRVVDEFREAVREMRGQTDAANMNNLINQGN
jgi:hypothetical protein